MLCGQQPGKKRLKCVINIDMNSIRLCDDTLPAVIAEFNLHVFRQPDGTDFRLPAGKGGSGNQ